MKTMNTIGIITATRAEYGLLYPVIKALRRYESDKIQVDLIVTGTHLVAEYGETINDILKDGIRIDEILKIPTKSNNGIDISLNQADILVKFANLFGKKKYSAVVLLGDRYETLMFAIAAANLLIPIIHLYGGDTTEGALDESIRHSITKMSFLHFPTNEISRQRIIQLGEDPKRVFNFGAPGTDNIVNAEIFSKKEALESIGLHDCKYALCTYHPVTLEDVDIKHQIMDFIEALSEYSDYEFIITKSNSDQGGALINSILDEEAKNRSNIHIFASLGFKRYLSLMKYAEAVIGNSSSGIMEAPSFQVPTVNIGDRQRGRLQASNTINCNSDKESIVRAIKKAFSNDMKRRCTEVISPYGDGNAGEKIAKKIIEMLDRPIDLKKTFNDMKRIEKK